MVICCGCRVGKLNSRILEKRTAILFIMHTSNTDTDKRNEAARVSWRPMMSLWTLNAAAWLLITFIGALTSFNEDLSEGLQPDFWEIFKVWARHSAALAALSGLLYACFSRWPQMVSNARSIAYSYGALLLILLPLNLLFVARYFLSDTSHGMSWDAIEAQMLAINRYSSLLRFSMVTAVYFAVVVVKIWQLNQSREKAWEQERNQYLALRLELEQQKLSALRAQLEPHFMYNALNAISALVLTGNKDNALNGIHVLSELLRYAMMASEKNSVKLAEEVAFVGDYLRLQRLRYGPRLRVQIDGMDDALGQADCLPLLLQPLVENAMRHDLDCHEDDSDIHMAFERRGAEVLICISNPLHAPDGVARSNPGLGLGLRNTRHRLQLAYGTQATLETRQVDGRFQVELVFPMELPNTAL